MNNKTNTSQQLHPNNIHKDGYHFNELVAIYPTLKQFVFVNKYGTETINFADSKAVKALNTGLLFKYYNISFWDFPDDNLCPPVPGRVDYIHYLSDLLVASGLTKNNFVLDIGTGANCIYPLLGNAVYGWNFVATDIDKKSLDRAEKIIKKNSLSEFIQLKHQPDSNQMLKGIVKKESKFAAAMCNPPFYRSQEEAMEANARKLEGLGSSKEVETRNFGGKQQELWYKGGEKAFIHTYLYESSTFKTNCFWYSTLVSKKENAESMYSSLQKLGATAIKTIPMNQGNKVTRIVAWTFLTEEEQRNWLTS